MLYVNTNAIAAAGGVTPATVAAWAREGVFPGARIERGRWAIPPDEAEAFLKDRSRGEGEDELEDGEGDFPDDWPDEGADLPKDEALDEEEDLY